MGEAAIVAALIWLGQVLVGNNTSSATLLKQRIFSRFLWFSSTIALLITHLATL